MDDNFYQHMMNKGFLIFEANSKFVLTKVPTPADPRPAITDKVVHNAASVEFDNYESAIKEAKVLCGWQNKDIGWKAVIMYDHYGLGSQMKELDEFEPMSYEDALKKAEQQASQFVEEFKKGEIEKWQVKVRPFKLSKNDTI